MKVSSSMIRTSVAISAASSRPECSTSSRKRRHVDVEHLGGLVFRQAFQRHQQERLARFRRDLREMLFDRQVRRDCRRVCRWPHRIPDFAEQLVERDAGRGAGSSTEGSWIKASRVAAT